MKKLITIVDKNNNVTGSATHQNAQREGLWHRIVVVHVFNSHKEIFIQKRSPRADSSPNMWDHSAAGHVDTGEIPINSAKRELKEELGISSSKLSLITTYKTQRKSGNRKFNRYWYVYQITYDGKINLQESELAEGKFVDINWLKKDMEQNPRIYTDGIKISLQAYLDNRSS